MHGSINVKSPNNTSKWQMGFNSAFKGLMMKREILVVYCNIHKNTKNILFGQDAEI
jgi:hypothetical protein